MVVLWEKELLLIAPQLWLPILLQRLYFLPANSSFPEVILTSFPCSCLKYFLQVWFHNQLIVCNTQKEAAAAQL